MRPAVCVRGQCTCDFGDLEASVSGQVAATIPHPMCTQEQKGLFSEVRCEAGWSGAVGDKGRA